MVGNVTIDPAGFARPATDLQIEQIVKVRTGLTVDVRKLISGKRYDRLIQYRHVVKEAQKLGEPRVVCLLCGTPVSLVARQDKSFFFRHAADEDDSCPAKTREALSYDQMRALKYQGQCESEAHRLVKERIVRSLAADARFSAVGTEVTWKSVLQPGKRRRPDVSAIFTGTRIAFEAQLSTTFLDVVIGRRMFYRSEGGLLVWILPFFDPEYRRMTDDDMLFSNNSNILVVDEGTVAASQAAGRFMVRCHYRFPYVSRGARTEEWREQLVDFGDLSLNLPKQQAFWFDFEAAEIGVGAELRAIAEERRRAAAEREKVRATERQQKARDRLFAFLEDFWSSSANNEEAWDTWEIVRAGLAEYDVHVPENFWHDRSFMYVLTAVLSAKEHRPVGCRFKGLIEVAHNILERHKDLLRLFNLAIKVYRAEGVLREEDKTKKWERKIESFRPDIAAMKPEFASDRTWFPTLAFLFPELAEHLQPKRPMEK